MRRGRIFGAGLAIVAVLLVHSAQGQQPPPSPPAEPPEAQPQAAEGQPEQPIFRAGINYVRVDVIVTDRQGNPITDLQASDFEVLEDGKPQAIDAFRFVKIDGFAPVETRRAIRSRDDELAAAADDDARIFVFFLDDYHVRLGSSMGVRRPLTEFIQNHVGPNDLLAVMYPLAPLDAVTLTRDHASIIRAIERFEGRKFNYEPRNAIEERYALYPAEVVERIRRQVTLSALEGLSVKLGSLREGRKAIILVSEGFTSVLPPQLRDPVASMPGFRNPARRDPMAGENNPMEDRAQFLGEVDLQQELRDVYAAANRHNTAIYAVDPRGLAVNEFDINENVGFRRGQESLVQTQNTLRTLADETDGRAIVNRNDLGRALVQIVTDSSAYYLLGYTSDAPQDGKFHEIRVRVTRPGVQIRSRKGYWALTASETARSTTPVRPGPPPEVNRALSSIAEPTRGRYVRSWVGSSRGENGLTRLTFVWEPIPAPPGVRRDQATFVALTAGSPNGELYFNGRVPQTDGPGTARGNGDPATEAGGSALVRPGASVTFDAPPGRLQLRMQIANGDVALDTDDREIVVPDLTVPEVVVATPRVHVVRNALELQALRREPNAVPTASREFRRTDRLIIRLDAFGPGSSPVTVASRLLNRQGQKMTDLPVTAPTPPGQLHVVDLPLASLAPGEYLLEVSAEAEGHPPATELIAFRLGS